MNRANRPRMSRVSGSSYASKLIGRAGDGSTLSIDFTTGVLDPRITFSRADATARATFINNLGYVTTVSSAQDPRFDYDPTTLVAKGLLLEAPATNLLKFSAYPDSGWLPYGGFTRPSPYVLVTSPANDSTATKLNFTAVGNGMYVTAGTMGYTNSIGSTYTFSIWLRATTGTTNASLRFSDSAVGSFTTVSFTNTWTRYQFEYTALSNSGPAMQSASGTATGEFECWGCQLELGAQRSSYIPTTSAAVTRAVDTAIIAAGSNFSSWYTGGTTGTFVANWYGNASSSTARSVIATNDQTTKHLHMYQTASALTLRLADFGAAATVTTSNSLTAGALTKGAFSYNGTATSLCLNGGTVATGTLAFSAAPTWLSIGGPSTNGTSITDTTVMLNNSIRSLKYFPARLSDGQIQGLTT